MTESVQLQPLLHDLRNLVEGIASLHEELALLIHHKLDAMRANHIQELRDATDREHRLIRLTLEQQERRQRIVDLLGKKLGMSPKRARSTSLSHWASHCADPLSGQMKDAAERLRHALEVVSVRNRISGRAADATLSHLAAVMTPSADTRLTELTYDQTGLMRSPFTDRMLNAVC